VNDHLADELLSALIDDQLSYGEEPAARTHLGGCADCQIRLQELRSVVVLLRALPSLEPPREFALGPRLVADPPNVIRLRRWYTVARAGAASLAAAFVFLSVGTLYVDSRPVVSSSALSSKAAPAAQVASDGVTAPSSPAAENVAAPTAQAQAARQAAPAAAQAPGPPSIQAPAPAGVQAPAAGAALAAKPSPAADAADQVAAATSVRPLPTPVPTPVPTQLPFVAVPVPEPQVDTAAPLRAAAAIVGVLTVVVLLVAVLVRHRLRAANFQTE
jgi:hypothetical protein